MSAENFNKLKFNSFNLIPPISQEEIKIIEKRDNSIIYSFSFILVSVLSLFVLSLIQILLVDPKINSIQTNINSVHQQINSNNGIVMLNGELITKGNVLLKPILDKDIKLKRILDISNEIAQGSVVSNYVLEDTTGDMVLTLHLTNTSNARQIYNDAKKNTAVTNVFIRRIESTAEGLVVVLSFKILPA